jgi:hypothetical protein
MSRSGRPAIHARYPRLDDVWNVTVHRGAACSKEFATVIMHRNILMQVPAQGAHAAIATRRRGFVPGPAAFVPRGPPWLALTVHHLSTSEPEIVHE